MKLPVYGLPLLHAAREDVRARIRYR